jgi:glycosyltransferase involved in cell wall biosynthesis
MGKVQVIRTGIPRARLDLDAARAKVVELAGPAHAGPIISLVGQLIPGKGHAELLEVLPELLRRLPSTRILFIGGSAGKRFDGYVAGLRTRIEELGVGGVVHLVGHRDDALTLIAGSDIIVMPSLASQDGAETEGFPLIALEALSVGTPLVAYEVGGVLELAGDCALLVKAGDRGQLLEAIHRVAADGATRKSLSTCGPRRVAEQFTMDRMIEALQSAYRLARRA